MTDPPAVAPDDESPDPPVILDSNVIFSALRSPNGSSNILVRAALIGRLRIALTTPLCLEYEDVTNRTGANPLRPDQVRAVLDQLTAVASHHRVLYRWPVLPDPADEKVLEAAVSSRAAFLVTYNLRDFPGVSVPGLTICEPRPFLRDHRPDLRPP